MKRALLLLATLLAAALALFGCRLSGNGDGSQQLARETPTQTAAATRTEAPATPTETPVQGADASNPRLIAQGEIIYQQQCASCHGVNLEGQPNWRRRNEDGTLPAPPHDATGHTWHHPDELLFDITKRGTTAVVGRGYKSNMQGFGDKLDDAEIWAVLAYIKSRWPPKIQAAQPQ